MGDVDDLLADVTRLTGEAEQVESTLDEAISAAWAAGASQAEIAERVGMSRSAVQRRLADVSTEAVPPSATAEADEEIAAFKREMLQTRLKIAKLELAAAAQRVAIRQEQARAIAEANAISRGLDL